MDNFKYVEVPMGFFAPNEPQRRGIDTILPLHLEKPVTTMNKKLIINVAPTGFCYKGSKSYSATDSPGNRKGSD